MLNASLVAADQSRPKRGFRAPSGKFYEWTKDTPPTQADVDAIVAFDRQHGAKPPVMRDVYGPDPQTQQGLNFLQDLAQKGPLGVGYSAVPPPAAKPKPLLSQFLDAAQKGLGMATEDTRNTTHQVSSIVAEGVKRNLPTGLLRKETAEWLKNNPDRDMRVLYHTIQNMDPTQVPGFIAGLTSKGGVKQTVGGFQDLLTRAAKGDPSAGEEIQGLAQAFVGGALLHTGASELKGMVSPAFSRAVGPDSAFSRLSEVAKRGPEVAARITATPKAKEIAPAESVNSPEPFKPEDHVGPQPAPVEAPGTFRPEEPVQPPHAEQPIPEPVRPAVPEKAPVEPTAPEQKYAASNAASNDLRKRADLPEVEPTKSKGAGAEDAAQTYDYQTHLSKLQKAFQEGEAGKKPRIFTDEENRHTAMLEADQEAALNAVKQKIFRGIQNGEDVSHLEVQKQNILSDIHQATQGSKYVGTEQSRALSSRNAAHAPDYSHAGLYREFVVSAGKDTPEIQKAAEEIGTKHEELTQRISDLESQLEQERANKAIAAEAQRTQRKAKTAQSLEDIHQKKVDAAERIKAKWEKNKPAGLMSDPFGAATATQTAKALAEIAPDVMDLVRLHVAEGAVKLSDVVAGVRETLGKAGVDIPEEHIHRIIAGEYEHTPQTRTEAQQTLQQLRRDAKAAPASQAAAINRRIAVLQGRIDSGEFPKARAKTPVANELENLVIKQKALEHKADAMKRSMEAQREWEALSSGQKSLRHVQDALFTAPRTLKASLDISAPYRQGFWFNVTHPKLGHAAFRPMMEALMSPSGYEEVMGKVRASDFFELGQAAGLHLTDIHGLTSAEEMFASKLAGRIPGVGASERAYTGYLNHVRQGVFDGYAKAAAAKGKPLTLAEAKDIANFVNIATGRGTGDIANTAAKLGQFFFAPRYTVSRFQLSGGAPLLMAKTARGRLIIAKEYGMFLGAVGAGVALAKAAGAPINLDPRSNDFGKWKSGSTTVDLLGGTQQIVRMLVQGTKGQVDDNGKSQPTRMRDKVVNFFGYKLSPLLSVGMELADGQDFSGNPVNVTSLKGASNLLKEIGMPIALSTTIDAIKENGVGKGLALSAISATGLDVNVRPPKADPLGRPYDPKSKSDPVASELERIGYKRPMLKKLDSSEPAEDVAKRSEDFGNHLAEVLKPIISGQNYKALTPTQKLDLVKSVSRKVFTSWEPKMRAEIKADKTKAKQRQIQREQKAGAR